MLLCVVIFGGSALSPAIWHSTILENVLPFSSHLKLLTASSFSLEESELCCL